MTPVAARLLLILSLLGPIETHAQPKDASMSDTLLKRIAESYGDSVMVDPARTRELYRRWIASALSDLGDLNENLKQTVLDSLAAEKIEAIRSAAPERRALIWNADSLLVALSPIDRQALAWAKKISLGQRLEPNEAVAAQDQLDQANLIADRSRQLPPEFAETISDRASEVISDLIYALKGGQAPVSLRLGKQTSE